MNARKQVAKASETPVETAPIVAGDRKMEQVRDLLFGGLARDYDRRFQELGDRLSQELARLEREFDRRVAGLESRLDGLSERLSTQGRQESSARTAAIDDLDARMGQAMRTQRDEINAGVVQVAADLARFELQSRDALIQWQTELAASLQDIRASTSDDRDRLRQEKVGRDDLADLMGELSLRLRGPLELPGAD
ncbi:hypothetical protein [Lysobacter terrae]